MAKKGRKNWGIKDIFPVYEDMKISSRALTLQLQTGTSNTTYNFEFLDPESLSQFYNYLVGFVEISGISLII
jgi:hypothetical protein